MTILNRPLFIKPDCETFYLLGALYNTSLDAKNEFPYQEILQRNKELYLDAKKRGGCRYPVDATPFIPEDWFHHYGKKWDMTLSVKRKI